MYLYIILIYVCPKMPHLCVIEGGVLAPSRSIKKKPHGRRDQRDGKFSGIKFIVAGRA